MGAAADKIPTENPMKNRPRRASVFPHGKHVPGTSPANIKSGPIAAVVLSRHQLTFSDEGSLTRITPPTKQKKPPAKIAPRRPNLLIAYPLSKAPSQPFHRVSRRLRPFATITHAEGQDADCPSFKTGISRNLAYRVSNGSFA